LGGSLATEYPPLFSSGLKENTTVAQDPLDYEAMVQIALREVVYKTMSYTVKHGLPGDHHYYITFATDHPGVEVPDYLRDQYGDEVTIVLQYEFWDLAADENGFSVTLCFDDNHEKLYVPYAALLSFVDPSVKFGLQFSPIFEDAPEEVVGKTIKGDKAPKDKIAEIPKDGSNVVTLDTFRKK